MSSPTFTRAKSDLSGELDAQTTLRITSHTRAQLDKIARSHGVARGDVIRHALDDFLARQRGNTNGRPKLRRRA